MSLLFEIVTPRGVVFQSSARHVKLPGSAGEFGILAGHTPFMTTMQAGVIELTTPDGQMAKFAVSAGFVEVLPEKIEVLAETAETASSIDLVRAEAAKKRAEDTLRNPSDKVEANRAHLALMRAKARIKAKGTN